ncbi:alpha/beta fold hydrolase [bacterium M00.F.Ca.ET.228.01.1.1]|uniref:YheT family hydrolase n=1 Tax=Paraburkholderia phenoliruptrix TaxID=252970 RepID=UPI001092CBE4|nr:alpha/beta fold hydrolase [Paraburkholderia phenoliruptrix]TGP44102.1 alpha/beta fold hydrolase [bacterium M00.F.Ca.ET.228.01.1.1]TGS01765.1 alpha/beta fold hydrolase [bacterium M00.F.Ca.ET.191.01.1.1]TGU08630.1 alpha/beta fold hydrolase [bacterium M00.F.Ca.ET.155.01.1.1]MBW0450805.1 alpha/beta fold hydrolase [Paraburkholderia phenoliruptrix]MBW9097228.1 alpha/beta fold hydrolase [Paraburkholderia phenoliruptrix]
MSTPHSNSHGPTTPEQTASAGAGGVESAIQSTIDATIDAGLSAAKDLLYRAPLWLPNRHVQTIVPSLFARRPAVSFRRERWDTPDGDFIDVDWVRHDNSPASAIAGDAAHPLPAADAPLLVLFHGLEGSSASHYASALMAAARDYGWHGVVPHFRSCSGELNRLPRFYHLADSNEVDWILRRLRAAHRGPLVAAGVSLGGNVLLRWLGERRENAASVVAGAAAISTPIDVHAGGHALSQGLGMIYTRNFLKTLKQKAAQKLVQFPGLFDRDAMLASRTMYEFDNVVTAPLHGFRNTDEYWSVATTRPLLPHIQVPTLVLNARNDPFLPARALPSRHQVSAAVELDQPRHGGHAGFMTGPFPGRIDWLSRRVLSFLEQHVDHG